MGEPIDPPGTPGGGQDPTAPPASPPESSADKAAVEAKKEAKEAKDLAEAAAELANNEKSRVEDALRKIGNVDDKIKEAIKAYAKELDNKFKAPLAGLNVDTAQNVTIKAGADWIVKITGQENKIVLSGVKHNIVGGGVMETIIGGMTSTIIGGMTESVIGNYIATITGAQKVSVLGNAKYDVSGGKAVYTGAKWFECSASVGTSLTFGAKLSAGLAVDAKFSAGASLTVAKSASFENVSGPKYKVAPADNQKNASLLVNTARATWNAAKAKITGAKLDTKTTKWSTISSTATLEGSATATVKGGNVVIKGDIFLNGPTVITKGTKVNGTLGCKKLIENPSFKAKP